MRKNCDRMEQARVRRIVSVLKKLFPDVSRVFLCYSKPWELLFAVMLSAQCTDKKVDEVTKKLFKKYRTLDDFATAKVEELEKDIYQTGFYRQKARAIRASALLLKEKYRCRIPKTIAELTLLPGVGRKTANVVLGELYGITEGVTVDTHVRRLAKKLGLTKHDSPHKIEQDLMNILDKKDWFVLPLLLIEYGRHYCPARRHDHSKCPLNSL